MHRNQTFAAFCLAMTLLSQSGCCCCVTIPTGPGPGEGAEFGEFVAPEGFGEEDDESSTEFEADADSNDADD